MYKHIFFGIICLSVCWLGSLFLCHYSFGCITLLTFCYSDLNVCTKKMIFFFFFLLAIVWIRCLSLVSLCLHHNCLLEPICFFPNKENFVSCPWNCVCWLQEPICVFSNKVILFLCPWNCVCCYNMLELWIIILIALVITRWFQERENNQKLI